MTTSESIEALIALAGPALARNLQELDTYHYAPLLNARDEALTALVDGYRDLATPEERETFASRLSGWGRGTLSSFFDRMAMVAVRTRSIERLCTAAVALGISQYGSDPRDLLMTLPLLCRASELLAAGVEPYLQAAAAAPSAAIAAAFRSEAGALSTGCPGLPAMVREVQGPNGVIWINARRPIPEGW